MEGELEYQATLKEDGMIVEGVQGLT